VALLTAKKARGTVRQTAQSSSSEHRVID